MEGKSHDGPIGATEVLPLDGLPHVQGTNGKLSASHGETILVVEDDLGLRTMVGILLRSHGYRLLEASHPVEAESLVRHCIDPIHLVLMDVTLPGVNGYELARILLDIRPFPAMLFVSGYEQDFFDVDRTICVKNEFLLKPFGLNVLVTKIQTLLETVQSA
jgi:two-component system, cell cycle sensor histidine kinase and response regulator CckA